MVEESNERWLWIWYTPFGLGGVETFLLNHARASSTIQATMSVAGVQNMLGPLEGDFKQAKVSAFDWTAFYPAFMNQRPTTSVQEQLCDDIAALRPTVLAINDCTDFMLGAAPLVRRLRPFCTVIDTFHIDAPNDDYLSRRKPCVEIYDGAAGTNKSILERFRSTFPRSTVALRYVPNGVHVPQRERLPPSRTLKMLYVGRLAQEQKRILELPGILARLRDTGKQFEASIIGDGPQRAELSELLKRFSLTDVVHLHGFVPPRETIEFFFSHDVVVNLSSYEGFSMTILEALAAGCVPVCTDLPCLDHSVFQDRVNCRLCPTNDLSKFVETLADLGPDELTQLSAGAVAVGRNFTAYRMAEHYADFVNELRERRPLRPWPADARGIVAGDWDMTRHNPWLARPHPVKKWMKRVLGLRSSGPN